MGVALAMPEAWEVTSEEQWVCLVTSEDWAVGVSWEVTSEDRGCGCGLSNGCVEASSEWCVHSSDVRGQRMGGAMGVVLATSEASGGMGSDVRG